MEHEVHCEEKLLRGDGPKDIYRRNMGQDIRLGRNSGQTSDSASDIWCETEHSHDEQGALHSKNWYKN